MGQIGEQGFNFLLIAPVKAEAGHNIVNGNALRPAVDKPPEFVFQPLSFLSGSFFLLKIPTPRMMTPFISFRCEPSACQNLAPPYGSVGPEPKKLLFRFVGHASVLNFIEIIVVIAYNQYRIRRFSQSPYIYHIHRKILENSNIAASIPRIQQNYDFSRPPNFYAYFLIITLIIL